MKRGKNLKDKIENIKIKAKNIKELKSGYIKLAITKKQKIKMDIAKI